MLLRNKASELKRALANAVTYQEWKQIALELDDQTGNDLWKLDNTSDDYNYQLLRERLMQLRQYHRTRDYRQLVRSLREGLHHDLGNMGNPRLYNYCNVGTKRLIEDYLAEVCHSLEFLCHAELDFLPHEEKLRFFRDTSQSFGQPALMLSGGATLGMFHIGVVKALFEQGVLPDVISGSSAGAIIAAMVGTRTDAELTELYKSENMFLDAWQWNPLIEGITGNGFANQRHLQDCLRRNIGEYSFEEGYQRSGRRVNVSISPVHEHQKARLMNDLTAPYLMIWSAVLASCAVPILFPAVTLTTKDADGNYMPYMPMEQWVDGSVKSDLPKQRLMHLCDVNYFIVSQVNPHIVPFLESDKTRSYRKLSSIPGQILRKELQFHASGALDLLRKHMPTQTLRMIMDHGYAIVAQKYYGDITIHPHGYTAQHYRHMLSNPSPAVIDWFLLQGERATWPKLAHIQSHAKIHQTLHRCVATLEENRQRRGADVLPLRKSS